MYEIQELALKGVAYELENKLLTVVTCHSTSKLLAAKKTQYLAAVMSPQFRSVEVGLLDVKSVQKTSHMSYFC